MRTHKTFGYIVFLYEEIPTNAEIPPGAKGATPFDTGGLWIGAIRPVKTKSAKRSLFTKEEVALDRWRPEFLSYIDCNYSDAKDYVAGEPPKSGINGISRRDNEARAWTWEVRYPSSLASSSLRLERAYMHRDDRDDYLDWLPRSGYEDDEIFRVAAVVESRVKIHEENTIMASAKAKAALLGLI